MTPFTDNLLLKSSLPLYVWVFFILSYCYSHIILIRFHYCKYSKKKSKNKKVWLTTYTTWNLYIYVYTIFLYTNKIYTPHTQTLILCGIDSARCWKHSLEILVQIIDMLAQLLHICWLHIHDANLAFQFQLQTGL